MARESIVYTKSKLFARHIVQTYKSLTAVNEFIMSKQLLRCGTSIGANMAEALRACSDRDFLNKTYIAYKEAGETGYWLELLVDEGYISREIYDGLISELTEIDHMLSAITKTIKQKLGIYN